MHRSSLPLGCNTGLITEITYIGVYAFQSDAEINGLCSSGTATDDTGLECASVSSHESALFLRLQDACIGKDDC